MRSFIFMCGGVIIGAITTAAMAAPAGNEDIALMDTMRTNGEIVIETSHAIESTGCANGGTITVSVNELQETHVHIICGGVNYWSYTVSRNGVAQLDIKTPPR